MEKGEFDLVEYIVFGLAIALSLVIGVYFSFCKGSQKTVEEYLFGGKKMGLLPISFSLISSFVTGVLLLGVPSEVYIYGTQYMVICLSFIFSALFVNFFILPVFYKLQIFSAFEYLELRFDARIRKVASFIFTIFLVLFIPLTLYTPALALNQVTGLPIHLTTMSMSVVCIYYTTVGGLKAVVWADTLQGIVMYIATILVAVLATIELGGVSAIFKAAEDSGRLELFQMQLDPRHLTFWTVSIGLGWMHAAVLSTNPSYMQRFIALGSLRMARWSLFNWAIGSILFLFLSGYMGLCSYAKFKDCDPLLSGAIKTPDQILPFFIVEAVSKVRGLPGIFIAGLVCAALSTMSTFLNTVSGTIYSDFIVPYFGTTTEQNASNIMKILSLVVGIISVAMVLVIEQLGTILELTIAFTGLTIGTTFGVLFLGFFFPQTNNKGAAGGAIFSLCALAWIAMGTKHALKTGDLVYGTKPMSVESCNKTTNISRTATEEDFSHTFPLFAISVHYYSLVGTLLVILVGLPLSYYITGPNRPGDVNRDLLSPVIHRYLPTYQTVPTQVVELKKVRM